MAPPEHNINGLESGRPSNADEVKDLFEKDVDVDELEKKIKKRKGKKRIYSMKDATLYNGLTGNTKVQVAVVGKRYAEKTEHSGSIDFNTDKYLGDQS